MLVLVISINTGCATSQYASLKQGRASNIPIIINHISTSSPNSAGGIDANINFINTSNKIFKYVLLEVTPFNRVGDVSPSEIGNKTTTILRAIGPFKPNQSSSGLLGNTYWENVWYNHTIRCIELNSIEILFTDGNKIVIEKENLEEVIAHGLKNSCSI